jgi:hypothetical protein
MAYLDVDIEASLNTCILNLRPHLDKDGYIFIDEFVITEMILRRARRIAMR